MTKFCVLRPNLVFCVDRLLYVEAAQLPVVLIDEKFTGCSHETQILYKIGSGDTKSVGRQKLKLVNFCRPTEF
jgi:hypothetical protein